MEWKPNAPALKKAFNDAPKPKQQQVASLIQIKKLEQQRRPPTPQLNLKQGPEAIAARAQASRQREVKIAEMKQQLSQRQQQARKSFDRFR